MVLIDSNGDKIHASVKKELVNQFEHQLEQGKTLTFTNFSLNHSVGSYRTTNHLYKISVFATTRVRSCEALHVSLNGFTPVNFHEVLDGSLNPDFLIDVIRHVVEVSHVEMISVNGKETQKISLELHDLADVRLPMVLWRNFSTDVTNAIQLRDEGRVILVLRFGKIKVWKDIPSHTTESSINRGSNEGGNVSNWTRVGVWRRRFLFVDDPISLSLSSFPPRRSLSISLVISLAISLLITPRLNQKMISSRRDESAPLSVTPSLSCSPRCMRVYLSILDASVSVALLDGISRRPSRRLLVSVALLDTSASRSRSSTAPPSFSSCRRLRVSLSIVDLSMPPRLALDRQTERTTLRIKRHVSSAKTRIKRQFGGVKDYNESGEDSVHVSSSQVPLYGTPRSEDPHLGEPLQSVKKEEHGRLQTIKCSYLLG
uniref:Replication protein A 70 kDa DNA-binding subunit B/D first OB fold domain-containing protein n=1 Tax=Brassica oleracea TaxID=3712 RepID=A0A3P6BLS2_BRAOL|nr:unnamed protein product [Brassica oleracea]